MCAQLPRRKCTLEEKIRIVLEEAIRNFVDFYNHWRYPKALNDVIPTDMLKSLMEAIGP